MVLWSYRTHGLVVLQGLKHAAAETSGQRSVQPASAECSKQPGYDERCPPTYWRRSRNQGYSDREHSVVDEPSKCSPEPIV